MEMSSLFPLSLYILFLITECRLPRWNIALIVVGGITMVNAFMGTTVALLHEFCIVYKKHGELHHILQNIIVLNILLQLEMRHKIYVFVLGWHILSGCWVCY